MKNRTVASLAIAVVVMVMLSGMPAYSAYSNDGCVIASGGGDVSGGTYSLRGTIGQAAVGVVTGGTYKVESGFWYTTSFGQPAQEITKLKDAKSLADGTPVHATGKIATTDASDFTGFFYIEEADRSSGIRVVATSIQGTLARGKTIEVTGIMATTAAGERYIDQATAVVTGTPSLLGALGMNNKSMGGSTLGTPPLGQYGVPGGSGTNNIGLLVRVWGRVKVAGSVTTLDDGSAVSLTVDTSGLASPPANGTYTVITGISSLYGTAGTAERLLLAID